MKETMEEVAQRLYPVNNTGSMFMASIEELNNSLKQEGFINGYKLAQERSYSEEELIKIIKDWENYQWNDNSFNGKDRLSLTKWLNKVKKK